MSRFQTYVCDRCGSHHPQVERSGEYPVQQVKWLVPTSVRLHSAGESARDLCTPCRTGLQALIKTYVTPPA